MSCNTFTSRLLTLTALMFLGTTGAQANVISGDLWHVPEAVVNSSTGATPGNVPGTTPDVTFSVNSPFDFNASNATVGTWLSSSSAYNIIENTAGTLASLMDNGTNGTLVNFTGFVSVANGQTFTVTHDDGLSLIINGINLGFDPGPTAPTTSTATYTGPSGNFAFQLVYTECCGGPAVLQVDLPFSDRPVPEPATVALFGVGLVGLGFARRTRRSRA